tara:strand:+ start:1094 stop:1558 length:465 start_codon:yes stop_codon:yes gene_type:complete
MKYILPYAISGIVGSFFVGVMSIIHHSLIIKTAITPNTFIIPVAVGLASGILVQHFKIKWETAAIEKERTKFKTTREITGAICHEFNQPLMVISGHLEMLIEEFNEKDIGYTDLMEIQKQTKRISHLTHKLSKINDYVTKPYLSGEIMDIHHSQ